MKRLFFITLIFCGCFSLNAQNEQAFEQAYDKINCMLEETCPISFKDAVFIVENAYYDKQLDKQKFDQQISTLTNITKGVMNSRNLLYNSPDKGEVTKYAALFSVMTDSISIQLDSGKIGYIMPYTYDFNDIWGYGNWSNMFVSKLLETKKGNCHSLPFLYKILADEIGAKAQIAVAPNHFYIKHYNKANGWYNTELTSGIFPVDAWLMASGYIHLDAVVNKLYMEALNEKQMLVLCMVDLAKGYERKLETAAKSEFTIKCCETALKYYPNYVNALILEAETRKKMFDGFMKKHNALHPTDILHLPEARYTFEKMTTLYGHIHQLGYRRMPEEMYLEWLLSLKEERGKYENKKIANFNPKSN
jgi:hypothetical protein